MLGPAHLEALPHINSRAPTPLDSNGVERPGIKRLGKILAKNEFGFSEQKQSPQLSPTERPDLHVSREHVAGEGIARVVDAARNSRIRAAQVGINFVVRWSQVELSISPEHVVRKEQAVRGRGWSAL